MASEWDKFKDEIILLYLVEGLTLKKVSSQMVQTHGFDKKKHQYEYVLKKWNISKNTKREMWEYVDHVVQKRQKQDRESQVQMHGIRLSDTRVKKAMQRYGRLSLADKFRSVRSPRSPENGLISISTPPAPREQIGWPKTLPWVQFDNRFQMNNLQVSDQLMDSVVRTLATLSIDVRDTKDSEVELERAISTALHESLNWRAAVNDTLPYLQDEAQESVLSPHIHQPAITPSTALKSLLFQLSNNRVFVGHALLAQNMMRLIHALGREIPKALDYVMRSMDPTSAAIKETFFTTAVRFGQTSLIAKFLVHGWNPNALIHRALSFKIELHRGKAILERNSGVDLATPLQLAAAACDIEMASILLQYGAKPDFGNPTPLQIVCSLPVNFEGVRFARLLLQHGASLNTNRNDVLLPPLLEAVASGNAAMVRFLVSQGGTDQVVTIPPAKHCQIFGRVHESCPWRSIYPSHIRFTFPYSRQASTQNVPFINGENITALQIAIVIDDKIILETLIPTLHSREDRTDVYRLALVTACLAADEEMVCRFLDAITDIRGDKKLINYTLCAAAWISDCKIARRLLQLGAGPEWQVGFTMSAVQAAAFYGNIDLINLLHSCGYDINLFHIDHEFKGPRDDHRKHPAQCRPLECAIRVGNIQTVQALLQLGAQITREMFALAIAYGDDGMISDLLARGADVNSMLDRALPLEIALEKRRGLALISKLVDSGAQVSPRALITAIRNDDEVVSKYMLDSGVDILAVAENKETVLDAAAQTGNVGIMQKYFDCGGNCSSKSLFMALDKAISSSDYSAVEYLIQQRPTRPMDAYENTVFVQSILKHERKLAGLFLKHNIGSAMSHYCWHHGVNLKEESCDGPRLYIRMRHDFMRSDPEEIGTCFSSDCSSRITPLWAAAHMQQKPLVEHFVSANHPPDAFLLESALYNPRFSTLEIRQQLTAAYPLASIKDNESCRRLLMAAFRWNAGNELMQQHINSLESLDFVFGEHRDGKWTPLQLAARKGSMELVRLLLDAQANINGPAAGAGGGTALQMAVEQGNFELTMFLLDRGADINAPGCWDSGYTALQVAVSRGDLKMTMFLLDNGADANGPPSVLDGMTAIEISAKYGLIDMVALLLPHICLHGHLRLHFVRAVVFAEEGCHHAIANLLKHGRWTEEDNDLSTTSRAIAKGHTCPRFLYNEQSWEGKCLYCGTFFPRKSRSDSSSSSEGENNTHSVDDPTEFEEQVTNAGAMILTDDLALPDEQSEILDTDQFLSATDWSLRPSDTTRWLDDLVNEYFESFEGNWQEACAGK